jgi:hypothetical protein
MINYSILGKDIGELALNVMTITKSIGVEHELCVNIFSEIITNEKSFNVDFVDKDEVLENIKGMALQMLSIDEYIAFINYKTI